MDSDLPFSLWNSTLPCNMIMDVYKEFLGCARRTIWPQSTATKSILHEVSNVMEEETKAPFEQFDQRIDLDSLVTYDDAKMVMTSLGLNGAISKSVKISNEINGALDLLADKNASSVELKQSFDVFDRNEDGFISAFELWSILRRLGLKEGMKYEECEEMIRAFDKDGDERINFQEFKSMMENAL